MGIDSAKLVEPQGFIRPPVHQLAPRLVGVRGIRLGLLDNAKPNAGSLLAAIGDELVRSFGVREIVRQRKTNPGLGATDAILEELEACGAVVVGTGD